MPKANCVFVVDDDPSARNGLARLLRTAGHDVRDFASADEFLEALGTEECGCVVLDAGMLGLLGEEHLVKLTERYAGLPIVVVTADDNTEIRRKAEEIKAVGFFRKPIDGTALLDAIDWALRSSSTGGKHD